MWLVGGVRFPTLRFGGFVFGVQDLQFRVVRLGAAASGSNVARFQLAEFRGLSLVKIFWSMPHQALYHVGQSRNQSISIYIYTRCLSKSLYETFVRSCAQEAFQAHNSYSFV